MEISFRDISKREIVNVFDGKRLGHILDIVFDEAAGCVTGFVVPGLKKGMFKKVEDIFVPLANVVKMGSDCILVRIEPDTQNRTLFSKNDSNNMYDYYIYPDKKEGKQ